MDQYDARHHGGGASSARSQPPMPGVTGGHKKHASLSSISSSGSSANSSLPAWLLVPFDGQDRRHSVDNQQERVSGAVPEKEKESAGEKIKGRLRALTGGGQRRPMDVYQAT